MAEFNALIQEALVGTEIQRGGLASAQTREAVARGIRYRRKGGTLALSPPGRVMMLTELVSPWANITYGGCRYLREARLETLRKYSVLHEYFKELDQPSIFDRVLDPEDEEYVLMALPREECTPDPSAAHEPVAIRGWGNMPGSHVPVPGFGLEETALTWVNWAQDHDWRLCAAVLEWVLMNPNQRPLVLSRVGTDPEFRKVFLGHYHDGEAMLGRLGSAPIKPPSSSWRGLRRPEEI